MIPSCGSAVLTLCIMSKPAADKDLVVPFECTCRLCTFEKPNQPHMLSPNNACTNHAAGNWLSSANQFHKFDACRALSTYQVWMDITGPEFIVQIIQANASLQLGNCQKVPGSPSTQAFVWCTTCVEARCCSAACIAVWPPQGGGGGTSFEQTKPDISTLQVLHGC